MTSNLLREILDSLQSGDILLGDAFYATWFLLWDLIPQRRRWLVRNSTEGAAPTSDFSKGEKIGARSPIVLPSRRSPIG